MLYEMTQRQCYLEKKGSLHAKRCEGVSIQKNWFFKQKPQGVSKWKGCCLVSKSCLTLRLWTIYSPAGFSVHGLSQQEYWSGLPCPPPPGDLPDRVQSYQCYQALIYQFTVGKRAYVLFIWFSYPMEKVITSLQTSAWLRSVVEWFPLVLFSKINERTDKPVLCHSCYCYIPYLSIDRTSIF